jgi:hypothetical protein
MILHVMSLLVLPTLILAVSDGCVHRRHLCVIRLFFRWWRLFDCSAATCCLIRRALA